MDWEFINCVVFGNNHMDIFENHTVNVYNIYLGKYLTIIQQFELD